MHPEGHKKARPAMPTGQPVSKAFLIAGLARSRPHGQSGAERDRTVDLMTASHALSQLSYSPDGFGAPAPRLTPNPLRIVSADREGCQPKATCPSPPVFAYLVVAGPLGIAARSPYAAMAPDRIEHNKAGVVELADTRDSKSREGNLVWVQLPPPACTPDWTPSVPLRNPPRLFTSFPPW
jgi:hypothetical protein